jgi:PAS domain-containing protein
VEKMPENNTDKSIEALRLEIERLKSDLKYFEKRCQWLEAFMDSAPFVAYIKNAKREYAYFNPMRQKQFGLEPDDILWHTDLDLIGNLWGIMAHEQDDKVLDTNQVIETREWAPRLEQEPRNWHVVRFPFTSPDGESYIGAVGIDIAQAPPTSAHLPPP